MLDVRQVLAQKERDLKRVRREVQILLRAIPLLRERAAASTAPAELPKQQLAAPTGDPTVTVEQGMAELELYYPFAGRSAERR